MIQKNVIKGITVKVTENYQRNYELIDVFNNAWIEWLKLGVQNQLYFQNYIPTNGIVESIEKICSDSSFGTFGILHGEVGFYKQIFKAYNINYKIIKTIDDMINIDLICMSYPFSAYGSITDFQSNIVDYCEKNNIKMFLDGAYIGTTGNLFSIPKCCEFLALSASKPFNAPGLRSGILFTKQSIPKNFKTKIYLGNYNYFSMPQVISLLQENSIFSLYQNYRKFQEKIANTYKLDYGQSVILLYTKNLNHQLAGSMIYNDDCKIYRCSTSIFL